MKHILFTIKNVLSLVKLCCKQCRGVAVAHRRRPNGQFFPSNDNKSWGTARNSCRALISFHLTCAAVPCRHSWTAQCGAPAVVASNQLALLCMPSQTANLQGNRGYPGTCQQPGPTPGDSDSDLSRESVPRAATWQQVRATGANRLQAYRRRLHSVHGNMIKANIKNIPLNLRLMSNLN